jgi:hypothetical protein
MSSSIWAGRVLDQLGTRTVTLCSSLNKNHYIQGHCSLSPPHFRRKCTWEVSNRGHFTPTVRVPSFGKWAWLSKSPSTTVLFSVFLSGYPSEAPAALSTRTFAVFSLPSHGYTLTYAECT